MEIRYAKVQLPCCLLVKTQDGKIMHADRKYPYFQFKDYMYYLAISKYVLKIF